MPKIMLIEDDRTMLSLLTILLQMEGFEVCSPTDDRPEDILAAIRMERPDVTLLDVNLRLGNGIDLLSQMRSDVELKAARVIMTSGLNVKHECAQAGADNFLLKPYMPDELIKLVKETLGIKQSG
jgi:two-component system response regulator CpxR